MKKVFEINVYLDEFLNVESDKNKVCMILFHGDCDCDFFKGKILNGGVDTQKFLPGETGTPKEKLLLSARYMLEGVDSDGNPAKIFVENNGTCDENGKFKTKPVFVTDSKKLSWLEDADFTGTIRGVEKGIVIEFWEG